MGHHNRKLSESDKSLIIEMCLQGASTPQMAKRFGVSTAACWHVIKRAGMTLARKHHKVRMTKLSTEDHERIIELARGGAKTCEIAPQFGVSVQYINGILKRFGVKPIGSRRYSLNHHFFDSIDTEGKAWLLGFLSADGYVSKNGSVSFVLNRKDRQILFSIRDMLGSNSLVVDIDRERDGVQTFASRLIVTSRKMADRLRELSITHNKSWTLKPWNGPDDLMRHYWRGCVDGDGHIGTKKTTSSGFGTGWSVSFVGNNEMVAAFAKFVENTTSIVASTRTARPTKDGKHLFCSVVYCGLRKTQEIASLLYNGSTIHLERKKALAEIVQNPPKLDQYGRILV